MHVGERDRGDGTLRKADDEAAGLGAGRAEIRDADVVKTRSEPGDGLRGVLVWNTRVVLGNENRGCYVFHGQITKIEMADVSTAIPIRFYAHAIGRSFELHTGDTNVLHSSGNLAADRHAMPMEKRAIGDVNIGAGIIGARRARLTRLDGYVVITYVDGHVRDGDVVRGKRIDAICIG